MLELELDQTKAILETVSLDTKKRKGEGVKEPVTYLMISTNQDSGVLAFFEPTLEEHYFNKNGPRDLADGLPLRDLKEVYPHDRTEVMAGATLRIGYGVKHPMHFSDAILDKFSLTPVNGGRVIVRFRAEIRPEEAHVGKLYFLQEKEIELTVEPLELPVMKDAA